MRNGTLQSDQWRNAMNMQRKIHCLFIGHETKVIVAMGLLRVTARVYDIDLSRDLIARPEPSGCDQREKIVAVVVDKCLRVA